MTLVNPDVDVPAGGADRGAWFGGWAGPVAAAAAHLCRRGRRLAAVRLQRAISESEQRSLAVSSLLTLLREHMTVSIAATLLTCAVAIPLESR